jgi:hypothetical protein
MKHKAFRIKESLERKLVDFCHERGKKKGKRVSESSVINAAISFFLRKFGGGGTTRR